MVQEIVVFMINLFVEAIYIKRALCRRAQQTKSHKWRKNGKLIFCLACTLWMRLLRKSAWKTQDSDLSALQLNTKSKNGLLLKSRE